MNEKRRLEGASESAQTTGMPASTALSMAGETASATAQTMIPSTRWATARLMDSIWALASTVGGPVKTALTPSSLALS